MGNPPAPPPVICLAGPTGSGKTAAALALAREFDGEIINADSRQVYADFPCISAQPTPEEQARFPHHLYGFLPTEKKISAGQWAEMARDAARAVLARGHVPLLVGGTGMYFHALLHGIAAIPEIDPGIGRRITGRMLDMGTTALYTELAGIDPDYAARIHPNDSQRIARALEVFEGTGRPFSWWHKHAMPPPFCQGPLLVLQASLDWLEPRLMRRIDAMLAAGALDEARAAMARCDDPSAPGWSGIGCAETLALLNGRINLTKCREQWFRNTRAYAKRQLTWFRGRDDALFLPAEEAERAVSLVRACMPKFS